MISRPWEACDDFDVDSLPLLMLTIRTTRASQMSACDLLKISVLRASNYDLGKATYVFHPLITITLPMPFSSLGNKDFRGEPSCIAMFNGHAFGTA